MQIQHGNLIIKTVSCMNLISLDIFEVLVWWWSFTLFFSSLESLFEGLWAIIEESDE